MSLPYEHELIDRAKRLRREATRQEKHLWFDFLKDYPARFQRQKSIGAYVVDFYCHAAKLAVEIDGSQHFEPDLAEYDRARTQYLQSKGIEVLRVSNLDVDRSFEGVCMLIDRTVSERA